MSVGKASALAVAILGVVMFAGVRSNVSPRAELATPVPTPQLARQLTPLRHERIGDDLVTGFRTPEDFAATVHAARNIRVPFMALRQQVVDEGKTLADAIRAVKPTANASLEADLARSEARAELAAIK